MNQDILKGSWLEIKGRVKEKWGRLTDNDLGVIEGNDEKLWGFYGRNMDTLGTKLSRNIKILSNWQKLSVGYAKY